TLSFPKGSSMFAQSHRPLRAAAARACAAIAISTAAAAYANHGPGASGGGSNVISGETLKQNKWEVSLREDFTPFDEYNAAQAAKVAQHSDDFDALHRSYVTSLEMSYGILDDLQVNLGVGYFIGEQFISAEQVAPGVVETGEGAIDGFTDMTVTLK